MSNFGVHGCCPLENRKIVQHFPLKLALLKSLLVFRFRNRFRFLLAFANPIEFDWFVRQSILNFENALPIEVNLIGLRVFGTAF